MPLWKIGPFGSWIQPAFGRKWKVGRMGSASRPGAGCVPATAVAARASGEASAAATENEMNFLRLAEKMPAPAMSDSPRIHVGTTITSDNRESVVRDVSSISVWSFRSGRATSPMHPASPGKIHPMRRHRHHARRRIRGYRRDHRADLGAVDVDRSIHALRAMPAFGAGLDVEQPLVGGEHTPATVG